jgi:hypothetical protein
MGTYQPLTASSGWLAQDASFDNSSMTVAAERALFVIALGSGERMPATRSTEHYYEV